MFIFATLPTRPLRVGIFLLYCKKHELIYMPIPSIMMRFLKTTGPSCEECGSEKIRRKEWGYRVLLLIATLLSGVLTYFLNSVSEGAQELRTYVRYGFIVFAFLYVTLGLYDFFEPKQRFRCRACGAEMERTREPIGFGFGLMLALSGGIILFLLSVWVVFLIFGPEVLGF